VAVSFLKRGKEAKKLIAKADAEREARDAQRSVRRFFVPREGESMVTFLDGELNADGLLDVVTYNEHKVKMNGSWRNYFPCTASEEPCPLCEQDDNHPALVSLFTVIDHTKWKDKNGKIHRHERKLFVAKRETLKRLQKAATKRDGLAGWRVTIGRVGDRSPEVGTDFDFIEQHDLEELRQVLKLPEEGIVPFDYDNVIHYYTADELRELGFGGHVVGAQDTRALRKKPRREADDDDDDDVFGDSKKKAVKAKAKAKPMAADDDDDEDDDNPFEAPKAKVKAKAKPAVADDDDDDDLPPVKSKKLAKAKPVVEDDEDEEEAPSVKPAKKAVKKPLVVEDDDEAAVDEDDDDGM
jgi:hypothetical protein